MRLWPYSRTRQRIREHRKDADRVAQASKDNLRNVQERDSEVDRVVGLLRFYSERNGFADAFEEMLTPRGRKNHGHQASR